MELNIGKERKADFCFIDLNVKTISFLYIHHSFIIYNIPLIYATINNSPIFQIGIKVRYTVYIKKQTSFMYKAY